MRLAPLAAVLALAGCSHRPAPPAPPPHYVVGPAWEARGVWHYPQEQFRYDATGLAERLPDRSGLTADGEPFESDVAAAAHQTLQLPAILRVTNLETGRELVLRANDRGPANPGRILGLTRRAADLLGVPASAPAQVRVQVEDGPSQALRDRMQGGPRGITAAPRGAVSAEPLPPPGGVARATRVAAPPPAGAALQTVEQAVPDRLPETVEQMPPRPGRLWIRAGRFSQQAYANMVKSKLSGLPFQIEPEAGVERPAFLVVAGPFATAGDADAALDHALRAGVTDCVIVVE